MIGEHIEPGVTTEDLDWICHDFIVDELDCVPAPLNYTFGTHQLLVTEDGAEVLTRRAEEPF